MPNTFDRPGSAGGAARVAGKGKNVARLARFWGSIGFLVFGLVSFLVARGMESDTQ